MSDAAAPSGRATGLEMETRMYDPKRLEKLPELGAKAPQAWQGFLAFNEAAFAEGALSRKHKELIAIAVALTTQCPYCLELHRKAALEAGASEAEIAEAVFVAAAIRAGGAVAHGPHLLGG